MVHVRGAGDAVSLAGVFPSQARMPWRVDTETPHGQSPHESDCPTVPSLEPERLMRHTCGRGPQGLQGFTVTNKKLSSAQVQVKQAENQSNCNNPQCSPYKQRIFLALKAGRSTCLAIVSLKKKKISPGAELTGERFWSQE